MTGVTYIRDSDRTRVIFIFQADEVEARRRAEVMAPLGFRLAAVCQPQVPLEIPMDGDNYGDEVQPPHWTPAAVS